eukprot:11401136-Alexandrium_andersonii.AAC.1
MVMTHTATGKQAGAGLSRNARRAKDMQRAATALPDAPPTSGAGTLAMPGDQRNRSQSTTPRE